MSSWGVLLDIVTLLAGALAFGALCVRFGQSPLVGYLLSGMLLGPGSFGLISTNEQMAVIAELGVALLLFSLGLEFSFARLKGFGSRVIWSGVAQVLVTLLVSLTVAVLCGFPFKEALAIGAMLSLSSTACVLRVLYDRGEVDSPHGRVSVATLLIQDMAVVPLAVLMTLLANRSGEQTVLWDLGKLLVLAAIFVTVLYVLINTVAARFLKRYSNASSRELAVLLAVVIGLGSTWAAHEIKISPALGAFLAGMFLGASAFATQLRADVSSLKVILLTLFFGAAGMAADPVWMFQNIWMLLAVTALIMAGKTAIMLVILRLMKNTVATAFGAGLSLSQIGEFAFVLGSIGLAGGVVEESTYKLIVCSSILSLFLTPYLIPLATRWGLELEYLLGIEANPLSERLRHVQCHPRVLVIGFGPAGRKATEALTEDRKRVVVIDLNPDAVAEAEQLGFDGEVGDAASLDILEHLSLEELQLAVITVPFRSASLTIISHLRRLAPQALIAVRARYDTHIEQFESAGAHFVIGDETTVGERLQKKILKFLAGELRADQDAELDVA